MHTIDRKTASRLLKVSVRTVDRYIVAKKLSIEQRDGRIWLDKKEILNLKKQKKVDIVDSREGVSTSGMSMDKTVSTPVDMSIDTVHVVSTSENEKISRKKVGEEEVYKNLFQELREELRIKQERLEGANYRVGQLEALVRESVPLLDHQKRLGEEQAARLELEEEVETIRDKLQKTAQKFKDERLNRRIYMVILLIIMLLQPLWLVLSMSK